jgi:hypothetical protein
MRFSERKGYKEVSRIVQIDGISDDLRTSLWNILYLFVWDSNEFKNHNETKNYYGFALFFWHNYFKMQIDTMPRDHSSIVSFIRRYFFQSEWCDVYDFLEFTLNYFDNEKLNDYINDILLKELSGYRFINGVITDITNKQEIEMLENALTDEDFPNVKAHLHRALELLSDRKNPDYRNSIKESISAVEGIAKEIAQKPKAELAEALKEIESKGKLHGAMKKAFLSLYGYTSDANGIRHALMEEPNLTADDAKFFLLTCTSFINYLKAKM